MTDKTITPTSKTTAIIADTKESEVTFEGVTRDIAEYTAQIARFQSLIDERNLWLKSMDEHK